MGVFRTLLALSVVLSHMSGLSLLVGGSRAVQIFYFISGFYMALILSGRYKQASYGTFIGNRLLRVMPLYYLSIAFMGARLLFAYLRKVPCEAAYGGCVNWTSPWVVGAIAFAQVAVLGQELLYFFTISPNGTLHFKPEAYAAPNAASGMNINPVSWTLSLEILFYLIAPFLLKRRTRTLFGLIGLSILLRLYLYYPLDFDYIPWRYRFFPTELAVFLGGVVAYRSMETSVFQRLMRVRLVPLLAAVSIFGVVLSYPLWAHLFSMPSIWLYGVTFPCVPFIFALSKRSNWDRWIGELSFPMYLFHIPLLSMMERLLITNQWVQTLVVVGVAGILVVTVTHPIDKLRERRLARLQGSQHDEETAPVTADLVSN